MSAITSYSPLLAASERPIGRMAQRTLAMIRAWRSRMRQRSELLLLNGVELRELSLTEADVEIQHDANEELSRVERSGPRRANRATIEPSRPATLGHCPAVGREEASAVTPSSTGDGERGSRLQADYAT